MPKISVIIPAFNEEKYIGVALEALSKQDYPDFEVIVVDNASRDRTAEVIRRFPVIYLSEMRKGTMWACEKGRREAKGEIIVRMDADCIPDKAWLSRGASHFQNPKVVGVTGPYEYFGNTEFFRISSLIMQRYLYRAISNSVQILHIGAIMVGGNSFMRAETLEKIGGFDTSIEFYGDDTDVAKRLSKYGKIVFDPHLALKSSARRFEKQGKFGLFYKYSIEAIKVLIWKKA